MPRLSCLALLAGLVLAACATGPEIRSDHAPGADFSKYRTYAIMDSAGRTSDEAAYLTLAGQRVRAAIHRQMEALGYTRVEQDPDLLVNFSIAVETKQQVTRVPDPVPYPYYFRYGLYDPWPYYSYDTWVREYQQGTLMIDLVDAETRTLVWEAAAEGRVTKDTRENMEARINEVVAKMFERFPTSGG